MGRGGEGRGGVSGGALVLVLLLVLACSALAGT